MDTSFELLVQKLTSLLPDRRQHKKGRPQIPKETLVRGFLLRLQTGCQWRFIQHERSVRRYFHELQRRGIFFNLLLEQIFTENRPPQAIIDATNINTWRGAPYAQYSGKYHNYCIKLTISITPQKELLDFSLDPGAKHDSKILDDMVCKCDKLPYELFLDKGYESYLRRRKLKTHNCQVRMEQKYYDKNRKRGPRFRFTDAHKQTRTKVEHAFGYMKRFLLLRYLRVRKISTLNMTILCALILSFHFPS